MAKRYPVFGRRFCTYCGRTKMYYIRFEDNKPLGLCDCGNIDWCDNETEADVRKRYGADLKLPDIASLLLDD